MTAFEDDPLLDIQRELNLFHRENSIVASALISRVGINYFDTLTPNMNKLQFSAMVATLIEASFTLGDLIGEPFDKWIHVKMKEHWLTVSPISDEFLVMLMTSQKEAPPLSEMRKLFDRLREILRD